MDMELLDFEKEDSGIESDSGLVENQRRRRPTPAAEFMQLSEASDIDDDDCDELPMFYDRSYWQKLNDVEDIFPHVEDRSNTPWPEPIMSSPSRISPPLYEVELTASDEEDEGSVLELVIPMRSPRYPKTTPSKFKSKFYCTLWCCFPK